MFQAYPKVFQNEAEERVGRKNMNRTLSNSYMKTVRKASPHYLHRSFKKLKQKGKYKFKTINIKFKG